VSLVQVLDEPWLDWLPAEQLAGQLPRIIRASMEEMKGVLAIHAPA